MTTPDYTGLIERLRSFADAYPERVFPEPTDEERTWLKAERPGLQDRVAASIGRHFAKFATEAATAIRTLLERNAELERELEMWRKVKHSSHWKTRAEDVEAKLAEAMKVIGALLACPSIADEDHGDPEWGCEETAHAERAARKFLKENGNGE